MAEPQPQPALIDLLRSAAAHHQHGQLREAEALYRQALTADPGNFDALHLYGVLMQQCGRPADALKLIGQALKTNGQMPAAHSNYGIVLTALNRYDEALASYEQAIALTPDDAGTHCNRANTLRVLERYEESLAAREQALRLRPEYPEALNNRGNALLALARPREALASYDRALALRPDYADALVNRGKCLIALKRDDEALASFDLALGRKADHPAALKECGHLLRESGRLAEALACYLRAIVVTPGDAEAHFHCGVVLYTLKRFDEAIVVYDRALTLKADYAEALNNRGNVLIELNRPAKALADYERALAIKPDYTLAHINRGNALRYLDRTDEALASFDCAITLEPNLADAHWNKGLLCLTLGDFERGWTGFEWRWRCHRELKPRNFAQPQWRGEDLTGKTILLHAEQGFGDSIQFLRYLPMVQAKGGRVVLELPDSLTPLTGELARDVTLVSPGAALPAFDVHCPLMSLPLAFGTGLETIPASIPYLRVPAERLEVWSARLLRTGRPRVGLVWSGRPAHKNDHNRSIALERLVPLLAVPGVDFVSLQQEYRDADRAALDAFPQLLRLEQHLHDFADAAAAIEQLDLVITVDTAVAHLAGALGKPLWLLISHIQDWRWLTGRSDSPWYPSARLFRQPRIDDWNSVIKRVAGELAGFATGSGTLF